ncbi:MAG: hypothetical protein RI907_964 [Pseudomonadota bacterium]
MSALLRRSVCCALVFAWSLGVVGCASTPSAEEALNEKLALQEKVEQQIKDADTAFKAGNTDQGMAALDEAIKLDPSAKQPWLRKAQFHFEKRQYGVAITEAQEALQRDVHDNTARSILAVSGLRVSAEAMEQLRKANEVNGSARSEAESVVKIIREALGEPLLVAAPAAGAANTEAPRPAAKPAPRPAAPRPAAPTAAATPATPAVATTAAPRPAPVQATPAPATAAPPVAAVRPRPQAAPAPAAGNGRSNPFGALQ